MQLTDSAVAILKSNRCRWHHNDDWIYSCWWWWGWCFASVIFGWYLRVCVYYITYKTAVYLNCDVANRNHSLHDWWMHLSITHAVIYALSIGLCLFLVLFYCSVYRLHGIMANEITAYTHNSATQPNVYYERKSSNNRTHFQLGEKLQWAIVQSVKWQIQIVQ